MEVIGSKKRGRESSPSSSSSSSCSSLSSLEHSESEASHIVGEAWECVATLLATVLRPHPATPRLAHASLLGLKQALSAGGHGLTDSAFHGLLAILPSLLTLRTKKVAIESAAVVGLLAISSYTFHIEIVKDGEVMKLLLNMLHGGGNQESFACICHSLLDLCTTRNSRAALRELGAPEKMMCLLPSFVADELLEQNTSLNEPILLILQVLYALMIEDSLYTLSDVQKNVYTCALNVLKGIWKKLRSGGFRNALPGFSCLAKLITYLAMELESTEEEDVAAVQIPLPFLGVKANFEHFLVKHWEESPCLLHHCLVGHQTPHQTPHNISLMLQGLLGNASSCPRFSSDELQIANVFHEIQDSLGKPLIFGEDVRIVKSNPLEPNAFYSPSTQAAPHFVDLQACIDAFHIGYTIAVRGMEFRSPEISAMSNALSVCFGQAMVGANLYLTPPGAQGLPVHYDDHCVLVFQLLGNKQWSVYPPENPLPRLYSQKPVEDFHPSEREKIFLVKEKDILYIPRGFLHEATTQIRETNFGFNDTLEKIPPSDLHLGCDHHCATSFSKQCFDTTTFNPMTFVFPEENFLWECDCQGQLSERKILDETNTSLHITFGIEVERPFEWEGFLHMSLHCWVRHQDWEKLFVKDTQERLPKGAIPTNSLGLLCTSLIHIGIKECGDRCSMFRKACLVAAIPLFPEDTLTTLIEYINNNIQFEDAYQTLFRELDEEESDCLDQLRWLHSVSNGDKVRWNSFIEPKSSFHNTIDWKSLDKISIASAFVQVASRFTREIRVEETCGVFKDLLGRYSSIRRKYCAGMLALHCQ